MPFSKIKLAAAAALTTMLFTPLVQAEGLSFNIGAVSLYKSNGIDQDARELKNVRPAIQGGVDYAFSNGFYVGNWNSTGKFGDGPKANLEMDLYAGYGRELSKDISYDLGVVRFIYPNDASWNANEAYGSVSYKIFKVKYTRGFSNGNKAARLGLSLAQPLSEALTLNAGVGFRNKINKGGASDYSVGVSYDLGNSFTTTATLSGAQTGEDKAGDAGKARLVLGLAKSF
jgi:uncharacterized protein (TIGR02001 family)